MLYSSPRQAGTAARPAVAAGNEYAAVSEKRRSMVEAAHVHRLRELEPTGCRVVQVRRAGIGAAA